MTGNALPAHPPVQPVEPVVSEEVEESLAYLELMKGALLDGEGSDPMDDDCAGLDAAANLIRKLASPPELSKSGARWICPHCKFHTWVIWTGEAPVQPMERL